VRFSLLGSGSGGNACVVASGDAALLVDCGLSVRQIEARLATLAFPATAIRAIVLTHEHDDHLAGAAAFARKYRIPIFLTRGTRIGAGDRLADAETCVPFTPDAPFAAGPFTVAPVIVPHDAREPCQFVISDGRRRLGILTDTGRVTAHLVRHFRALDALVLEFNHDPGMLARSLYPASLQARIAGAYGHLSNEQALALLAELDLTGLRCVVAAHLSEKTNSPGIVDRCLREGLPSHIATSIASQHAVLPWQDLGA
jgi:phosphoribosyl 1,2-cyclic phosphodiesterase